MSSDELHARARVIFLDAVELEPAKREAFVRETCGSDPKLRVSVEQLLEFDSRDELLVIAPPKSDQTSGGDSRSWSNVFKGRWLALLTKSRARRLAAIAVTIAAFVVLGGWTRSGVRDSLEGMRAEELQTLRDTASLALRIWAEEKKHDLAEWTTDERVRAGTEQLVAISTKGAQATRALRESRVHASLLALLKTGIWRDAGQSGIAIADRSGRVVLGDVVDSVGTEFAPAWWPYFARALDGEVLITPPMSEKDLIRTTGAPGTADPKLWVLAPIRDRDDEIIAVLLTSHYPAFNLSQILTAARPGQTGETYAFDRDGLMLSDSRFVGTLRNLGIVPAVEDDVTHSGTPPGAALRVQVRDPGGDIAAGHKPASAERARPLTAAAAKAIGSQDTPSDDDHTGLILEPYRNYRGVEVIGAWQWFPEFGFGVTTEMETREAYLPLRYIQAMFFVLFGFLAVYAGVALLSTSALARLRDRKSRRLGQYTLKEKLGEGGAGEVYLAEHDLLKRPTAMKILKADQTSEETITRFEREVQAASKLRHPNTIEIYDFGRTAEGTFYYVMEYVPGLTLSDLLSMTGAVSAERAIHILRQVCLSLREAHQMEMIHRDIKPANIMLCKLHGDYDVVKVLDFGLVKEFKPLSAGEVTLTQHVAGTPTYMAPERLQNPAEVDARSDIYSMGALAYNLITGENLFSSGGDRNLLLQILNERPIPPAERVSFHISESLSRLILDCLEKSPADRPATVGELLSRLGEIDTPEPWTQEMAARWWEEQGSLTTCP